MKRGDEPDTGIKQQQMDTITIWTAADDVQVYKIGQTVQYVRTEEGLPYVRCLIGYALLTIMQNQFRTYTNISSMGNENVTGRKWTPGRIDVGLWKRLPEVR